MNEPAPRRASGPDRGRLSPGDRERSPPCGGDDGRRAIERHLRAGAGRDAGTQGPFRRPGRAAGGAGGGRRGPVAADHRRHRRRQVAPCPRHPVLADRESRPLAAEPARHGGRQPVRAAPGHGPAPPRHPAAAGLRRGLSGPALRDRRHAPPRRRRGAADHRHHRQAERRFRAGRDRRPGPHPVRGRDRLHQGRRVAGRRAALPVRRPGARGDAGRQRPCRTDGEEGDGRLQPHRRDRSDAPPPRSRARSRRYLRDGEPQLGRPRRHDRAGADERVADPRPPQRLGRADPSPAARVVLRRLAEDLAARRRRPHARQRPRQQVLGGRRQRRRLGSDLPDPAVPRQAVPGHAGLLVRPDGAAGAGHLRGARLHRSHRHRGRRHRRPSGRAGRGVAAFRQAWEAAVAGIPLSDHARTHQALAQALEGAA